MPRIGNARTIADMEFVIDAPSFGADQSAWISHGVECLRDRHRFDGQAYSYAFEVLHLRFAGSKSEVRSTKSLRVIEGRSADVLSWMRKNRSAKLEVVTSPRHKA